MTVEEQKHLVAVAALRELLIAARKASRAKTAGEEQVALFDLVLAVAKAEASLKSIL